MNKFPINIGDKFYHYKTKYNIDRIAEPKDVYVVTDIAISEETVEDSNSELLIVYRNEKWNKNHPSMVRKISNFFGFVNDTPLSRDLNLIVRFTKIEDNENHINGYIYQKDCKRCKGTGIIHNNSLSAPEQCDCWNTN